MHSIKITAWLRFRYFIERQGEIKVEIVPREDFPHLLCPKCCNKFLNPLASAAVMLSDYRFRTLSSLLKKKAKNKQVIIYVALTANHILLKAELHLSPSRVMLKELSVPQWGF